MIRIFFTAIFAFLLSHATLAGDAAERRIIGFSPDGVWFAFEEFGLSDGTGAPYANIYVINTNIDKWANGTPIRVHFGEEQAPLSKALNKAMGRARPILNRLGITEPGILLASRPVTEITGNPRRVDFYRHIALQGPADKYSYVLKEINFKGSNKCKDYDRPDKGFSLSTTRGGAPLVEVYRDKSVPKSRNCPNRYEIADVIETPAPNGSREIKHIVLIHVYQMGFEGSDVRYIAVPVKMQLP
jgi:predicted secreted protein